MVISMKQTLLLIPPGALLRVSLPSVTVTSTVPSNHRVEVAGRVPLRHRVRGSSARERPQTLHGADPGELSRNLRARPPALHKDDPRQSDGPIEVLLALLLASVGGSVGETE